MKGEDSKPTIGEKKSSDSNGVVNNSLVVTEQLTTSRIGILLMILCALKLFEFVYFIYMRHVRGMKKKYNNNNNGQA